MNFETTVQGISKTVIEDVAKDTQVDYIVTIKDETEEEDWIDIEDITESF